MFNEPRAVELTFEPPRSGWRQSLPPAPGPPEPIELPKPESFGIVAQNHLLKQRDSQNDVKAVYANEVCWSPKRQRHVARWSDRGGYHVQELDDHGRPGGAASAPPTDWIEVARTANDTLGSDYGGGSRHLPIPSPLEEFNKAIDAFPFFRGKAEAPTEPQWLFDLGDCWIPKRAPHVDWLHKIEQHRLGFWGQNGEFSHQDVNDPELNFVFQLEPVDVQNSVAISLGVGTVLSRHALTPDEQVTLQRPGRRPMAYEANVVTRLGREGATWGWLTSIGFAPEQ
jgi:hypothetical protein